MFPLAIKNKRTEPLMTDRLATLTKRVAELCHAGLEACLAVKNSTFSGFTPSVAERYWHSNVHEWPILTMNIKKVVSLSFLHIVDNNLALI
jgi:hypothetical protein